MISGQEVICSNPLSIILLSISIKYSTCWALSIKKEFKHTGELVLEYKLNN
jgi:hypothetical protein